MNTKTVCIIGLGYVGLPLAEAFSSHLKTIAFDIDEEKVKRLSENNNEDNIEFTADPSKIKQADFVCIVGLPLTEAFVIKNK
jgi:UDPglucose 6-dehydrogenase/UDP-N-acetyl-D-galactosamine dehydrogenase